MVSVTDHFFGNYALCNPVPDPLMIPIRSHEGRRHGLKWPLVVVPLSNDGGPSPPKNCTQCGSARLRNKIILP
jgi:hypothetical protein